jgi:hypothetical protein
MKMKQLGESSRTSKLLPNKVQMMVGTTAISVWPKMAEGEAAFRTPAPASQAFWIRRTNMSNIMSWNRKETTITTMAQRQAIVQMPIV